MNPTRNGAVITVEGPTDPVELGITLTHEHLFLDSRPAYAAQPATEEERIIAESPLTIEKLGKVKRNFGVVWDAIVQDDPALVLAEVMEFKKLGGKTIVDVTPNGLHVEGFRPKVHAQLARDSGLNIILGCGYYIQGTHPPEVAIRSVDELAEEMLREIYEGIDGSGVCPGVIGEIGMHQPIHPDEWKVLEAACRVQNETDLPLYIHPYLGARSRVAPEIARFVLRQHVDPERINFCHMDGYMNLDYQRRVADMGFWISFDTFGLEVYYDTAGFNHNCHDSQREEFLMELLELGYQDQLMISHDMGTKPQLLRYGGYGYAHIVRDILPSLRYEGVDEETIDKLLVENPARFLTVDSSSPAVVAARREAVAQPDSPPAAPR
jgi:phosphotriesterase-related protein